MVQSIRHLAFSPGVAFDAVQAILTKRAPDVKSLGSFHPHFSWPPMEKKIGPNQLGTGMNAMTISVEISRGAYIPPYPSLVGPEANQYGTAQHRWLFFLWLDLNDFPGTAGCLGSGCGLDRDMASALTGKWDPLDKKAVRYAWKAAHGHPKTCKSSDPLHIAMMKGDLKVIADHLRESQNLDRVISWLKDQFAPKSPRDSHFVMVPPDRRGSRSKKDTDERLRIGRIVDRQLQLSIKYEFVASDLQNNAEVPIKKSAASYWRDHMLYKSELARRHLCLLQPTLRLSQKKPSVQKKRRRRRLKTELAAIITVPNRT